MVWLEAEDPVLGPGYENSEKSDMKIMKTIKNPGFQN